jgi:cytochrome d ubiquinol oxidase subunit II
VTVLQVLPMVAVLIGLVLYTVLANADLGTGIWQLTAGSGERAHQLRAHIYRAIGPIWEANHVWLIFVLTVLWTAYPQAFASLASTLVVPLFIAGIGIVLRGTAYALHGATNGPGDHPEVDLVFALSSLITPFALGAAVGAVASGRVPAGPVPGDIMTSWLGPTSLLVGVLAVAGGAFLAAVQLTAEAARLGEVEMAARFRLRALLSGVVAGIVAIAGAFVVRTDAPALSHGLLDGAGRIAVVVSVVAGVATLVLVWTRRAHAARFVAAVAVAALVAGWALAQGPTLLPGLTVQQAAAPYDTLLAVTVSIVAGAVIVGPSLALLFGLVLGGRMDRPVDVPETAVPARPPRDRRMLGRGAVGLFVAGAVLVVFASGALLMAVGLLLVLVAVVAGFVAVGPADLGLDTDDRPGSGTLFT